MVVEPGATISVVCQRRPVEAAPVPIVSVERISALSIGAQRSRCGRIRLECAQCAIHRLENPGAISQVSGWTFRCAVGRGGGGVARGLGPEESGVGWAT